MPDEDPKPSGQQREPDYESLAYTLKILHRRVALIRSTQAEQSDMLREILRRLPGVDWTGVEAGADDPAV